MYKVGRLCIKIAGRDAGLKCVIVDILENNLVLIDGQTRRRKCNIKHLEPLSDVIKIKKGISRADVVKEFKKLKIETKDTKPKKATERPKKQKKEKMKLSEEDVKSAVESKQKTKKKEKTDKADKKDEKDKSKAGTKKKVDTEEKSSEV